jgi:outer membrane biosynthesis protein TonB
MRHAANKVQAPYPTTTQYIAEVPEKVLVKVWIDESGNVVGARALAADPVIKQSAEAAARAWKFRGSKPIPACSVGLIEVSVEKKHGIPGPQSTSSTQANGN